MSNIPDRTRAEAQRDIAVAALKKLETILVEDTNALDHSCCGWGPTLIELREALARIAEIATTAPPTGWRDIGTAPSNESVLIFIPNAEHYGPGIYRGMLADVEPGPRWYTTSLHMGTFCDSDNQPTHWMPLPAPPQEKE